MAADRSHITRWFYSVISGVVLTAVVLLAATEVSAQIKAFPQAEGFGAASVGGRGGDVYHVTNLNNSGAGSLRFGIDNAPTTGRTIVFDVGGWITLGSGESNKLGIVSTKRKITIAGQTAPGGIGVRGNQFSIGGDDIVVRHMRFRPGKGAGRVDSANTNNTAERVIYDHVSAGFSYDENFSVQATDVTLQYSTVSFGLEDHSAGSLLENPTRLSMHHNLYAHNDTRNPKHRVYGLDWVDNVIYNWNDRAMYMQGPSDGSTSFQWTANVDGNYFIAGPNHGGTTPLSGGDIDNYETWWGVNAYDADRDGQHDGTDYTRSSRGFGDVSTALTRWRTTPFPVTDEIWKDASTNAAYQRVLSEFGATPWDRDEIDSLLASQVASRNGSIISHENQLVALGVSNAGFGTLGGVTAPTDTDQDGMPDAWETKHGLSPTSPSNNGDFDNDGYTNLEEYLNDLAAFKATGPLEFQSSFGRYADWQNWTRRWEPSRVDDVHVNNGEAIVDAVGQRAGNLRLGTVAGSNASVTVESGWLEVTDEIVIGADPAATAELYLSGNAMLSAKKISQGSGGAFHFNGGTLMVDEVDFDLVNSTGTIAPGHSPGAMHVAGDLTLNGGVLLMEIGGTGAGEFDQIQVDGLTTLGGTLQIASVNLGDGTYVPQLGDSFPLFVSDGGTDGMFSQMRFPAVGEGLKWKFVPGEVESLLQVVSAALAGDYNNDGAVDAADYIVWRNAMGGIGTLANETETIGMVDDADYNAWKSNFGAGGGGAGSANVPEPTSWVLAALALSAISVRRKSVS